MELGYNRQNLMNILWHLGVVAGSAVVLEVANNQASLGLDPKSLAVLAAVSPIVKVIIEGFKKN